MNAEVLSFNLSGHLMEWLRFRIRMSSDVVGGPKGFFFFSRDVG